MIECRLSLGGSRKMGIDCGVETISCVMWVAALIVPALLVLHPRFRGSMPEQQEASSEGGGVREERPEAPARPGVGPRSKRGVKSQCSTMRGQRAGTMVSRPPSNRSRSIEMGTGMQREPAAFELPKCVGRRPCRAVDRVGVGGAASRRRLLVGYDGYARGSSRS